MPLKIGSTSIGSLYLGSTKIAQAYLGSTKVYGAGTPALPPYTIRLKFTEGVTPTFSKGTATQVSTSPNVWDLTYANTDWNNLLSYQSDLIEVLAGNTTGVQNFISCFYECGNLTSVCMLDTTSCIDLTSMFYNCSMLTSVQLFDTSNVTLMVSMFRGCSSLTTVPLYSTASVTDTSNMFSACSSLTHVPLFDTSSVTSMNYMFRNCTKVQSGALSLYQQASTQANPPTYHRSTFTNCGSETVTGAAELAQIPTSWGGTMA